MKNQLPVVLGINTSSREKIVVVIRKAQKKFKLIHKEKNPKGEIVLSLIDKLLKEHRIKLEDITQISVNEGPGSFTGLRIGAAVANTLSYALKIPVNGKKIGEIVEPTYE